MTRRRQSPDGAGDCNERGRLGRLTIRLPIHQTIKAIPWPSRRHSSRQLNAGSGVFVAMAWPRDARPWLSLQRPTQPVATRPAAGKT